MSIINLTPTQLRQAAQLKEQIAKLQGELNKLAGTSAVKTTGVKVAKPAPAKKTKWKMSAAAKAKISAAAKARWAKIKAAKK